MARSPFCERIGAAVYDTGMALLERRTLARYRRELVGTACGTVLEVGAGTGVNLPHYDERCLEEITVTDRDVRASTLRRRSSDFLRDHAARGCVTVDRADVEHLPFSDDSFDTVLATLLFCSVERPAAGIAEIRRVLKPHGTYLFLEHVLPHGKSLARVFRAINPAWRALSGGCNLTRDTVASIESAGFALDWIKRSSNGVFAYGRAR